MLPARRIFSEGQSVVFGKIPPNSSLSDPADTAAEQNDADDGDSGIHTDLDESEGRERDARSTSVSSLSDWCQDESKTEGEQGEKSKNRNGVKFLDECEYLLAELKLNRNEFFWSIADQTALEMNVVLSEIGFLILRVNGVIQQTSKLIQNPESALVLVAGEDVDFENANSAKIRKLCRREKTNMIHMQRRLIREAGLMVRLQGQYLNQLWIQNDYDFNNI